jgi:CRISPR/Cas system-associated endoribonuclease Cas2
MKLNIVYDITNHTISSIDVVEGIVSDQSLSKNVRKLIKKGELRIRDLGYFNIMDMKIIDGSKAFFLTRLKKGVNIYLGKDDAVPVDIIEFLKEGTRNGKCIDRDVYIGDGDSRIKVRLIVEKVPDWVKEERIKSYKDKMRRDKKKKMKEDFITWFEYSVFVTNIPKETMASASLIISAYRIRWQIELFFLRIKSVLKIQIIKGTSVNRVYCIVFAKLISLLVGQSITSFAASISHVDEELSEYKLMAWLRDSNRLVKMLIGESSVEELLEELIYSYYLLCRDKRKRKSTFRMLQEALNEIKEVA